MKKSGLLQKIKSFVGATVLSSFLSANSLAQGTPYKIEIQQNSWRTSFPAQVKTTKMDNYSVIDKKDVPVYFFGKIDNPNSTIDLDYSTINLSTLDTKNVLGLSTYQTRIYVVAPEGVDIEILRESIFDIEEDHLTSRELRPKSETTCAKKMQGVGDWIIDRLRSYDPTENNANEIGLNDDTEKFGIYEMVKSWLVTKPEARTKKGIEKILSSEEKPQILQVDLYPQDRIVPFEEVRRAISLKINGKNYSGEKIPISIFERVQIGDSLSTTGQGIVEAYASFELTNLNKKPADSNLTTIFDKLVGDWIVGNNAEVWPQISLMSVRKKSDKVYSLEEKQIGGEYGQMAISIDIDISNEKNIVLKLGNQNINLNQIPTNQSLENMIGDMRQRMQTISEHENAKRNLSSTHSTIKDAEERGKPVNPSIKSGNEQGLKRESEELEKEIKEFQEKYPFTQGFYSGITNGGFWWKQNGLDY